MKCEREISEVFIYIVLSQKISGKTKMLCGERKNLYKTIYIQLNLVNSKSSGLEVLFQIISSSN